MQIKPILNPEKNQSWMFPLKIEIWRNIDKHQNLEWTETNQMQIKTKKSWYININCAIEIHLSVEMIKTLQVKYRKLNMIFWNAKRDAYHNSTGNNINIIIIIIPNNVINYRSSIIVRTKNIVVWDVACFNVLFAFVLTVYREYPVTTILDFPFIFDCLFPNTVSFIKSHKQQQQHQQHKHIERKTWWNIGAKLCRVL